MDFLLDPNVAYLFLLAGVLLGLMAVVTPGTGIFELGAFFCLVLAGYAVYNPVD
jgi:membrane-bound ClpP family serine protease